MSSHFNGWCRFCRRGAEHGQLLESAKARIKNLRLGKFIIFDKNAEFAVLVPLDEYKGTWKRRFNCSRLWARLI